MATQIEALLERAKRAERKRDLFESLMRDCYQYAMPERDGWQSFGYGQERVAIVYDSTAMSATGRFATRLQNALFPPGQRWARLDTPPELADADDAQAIQVDLDRATERLFRHIHGSNFDQAVHEFAHDLAAGVGCMLVENGRTALGRTRGPLLRFTAVPAAYVGFDEGPFGVVEGIFHTQRLPARNFRRTYPDARGVPPGIAQMEADRPDEEITLLQCTTYDAEMDRWCFQVLIREQKQEVVRRYYRTCPWVIARWMKAPGECYGRGPLTAALPDIRTLNKLREFGLMAAAFATAGCWTALDDGVLNPDAVRIVPGAVIPVRSNGGPQGRSLASLEFPGNFQLQTTYENDLRTSIRQQLFDDPLPPEVQVGLTATEVIERVRRFQADTGAFGRLEADAVRPLVARCIDILEEAGIFAGDAFAGLMEAVQQDIVRVVPTSPLAAAQDRSDVQTVMGLFAGLAQAGQAGGELLRHALHIPRTGRWLAQRSGVPSQLIPTEREIAEAAAAASDQAAGQALMQSPVAAQVAGALAGAAVRGQQGEAA
jgi:hypothetical protein